MQNITPDRLELLLWVPQLQKEFRLARIVDNMVVRLCSPAVIDCPATLQLKR